MNNHYLNIENKADGKIYLSASDGVFCYSSTFNNKEEFLKCCDEKVDMWLNSTLGNFEGWSKEDRKTIADKWTTAKELPEGKYDYYFNFGSKEDIFREEVKELAESMGITNCVLIILWYMENDKRKAIMDEIDSLVGRCAGRSTRLIDSYIQELYNHKGEWIKIVDHYGTPAANKILLERIVKRMANEHPIDTIEVNKPNNSIKLVHSVNDSINDRLKILCSCLDK